MMIHSRIAVVYAAFLFAFLAPPGFGQDLIIDQVRKTVVYLQGDFPCHEPRILNGVQALAPDGTPIYESECHQVGTGFIIGAPAPELGPNVSVPLLVTSKHLLLHPRLGAPTGVTEYFETLIATANTIQPSSDGSYISPIPILVKNRGYLNCSIDNRDPESDVAVCPVNISDSIYDFRDLSPDMFVTQSKILELKVNETDDVLFSGLFIPYHGAKRNYPIVRHGKLALIPKEKIPWGNIAAPESMQDLYLAEVTSWGGNSGSPVFVRLSGAREQGGVMMGVQYLLLGVMQGYFNSERPASLDTSAITDTAHLDLKLTDNSGIAAIVPAEKLLDVLMQPRLKAYVSLVKAIAFSKAGKLSEAEASYRSGITELRESDPQHPLLKEAYGQYAQFLRGIGRFTDANAQQRFSDKITGTQDVPDRQLR